MWQNVLGDDDNGIIATNEDGCYVVRDGDPKLVVEMNNTTDGSGGEGMTDGSGDEGTPSSSPCMPTAWRVVNVSMLLGFLIACSFY